MTDVVASALTVVKMLVIIGLLLYTGFAAVLVRQEQLMSGVLTERSEGLLRVLVLVHFFASIATVLLAFLFL